MTSFRAGAAARPLHPPLGLPMPGFVRSQAGAIGHGLPLETTAIVLESGAVRVVLCGVDTMGIQAPDADRIRGRVAAATGALTEGVLLNWNHTHRAPPSSRALLQRSGLLVTDGDSRIDAYASYLEEQILAVTTAAAERLEPARIAWGVGSVDLSVNRRDRDLSGKIVHGWRRDGLLDRQVISLQARRQDESPVATLINFGCHPVAVGMDVPLYSADFPGACRLALRSMTGGEAVFFQGAAGNVNPLCAFCDDEREAERMGERLALEVMHSLADRLAWPRKLVCRSDASLVPMLNFRFEDVSAPFPTVLSAAEEVVGFPLLPVPPLQEVEAMAAQYRKAAHEAEARNAGPAELFGIRYHEKWSRRLAEDLRLGPVASTVYGPINAVRIGGGVVVTGPGEVFTEIGMAVKEHSPGFPTMYAGYTNGAVSYFATSEAFVEGGYEPAFSNRSYGLPAPIAPGCDRLLTEHGLRLAERLFPDCVPHTGQQLALTGRLPAFTPELFHRPDGDAILPRSAPPPG